MRFLVLGLVVFLSGCRTSCFEINYNKARVGRLRTEEVHVDDSYYRIETTDGVELQWFPEIPYLNNLFWW